MKASTFQTVIVGGLCLAIAGLSGELYNQYQRLDELQSTTTQRLKTLDTLRHDLSALQDTQEKLQFAVNDLKQAVDTSAQQANILDPLLDQWAQEIQELRDGLAARATAADMTALRARLEQAEQRLELKTQPSAPPLTPSAAKPKKTARTQPTLPTVLSAGGRVPRRRAFSDHRSAWQSRSRPYPTAASRRADR
jgi:peptidoglycan hydrolase CwlO-like protein